MSTLYRAFCDLAEAYDEREEMRAEARAESARLRPHWCRDCLGHTGSNSPCYVEPDEPTRSCADGCNGCDECTDYEDGGS